jgi:chromosome segregation ATPase
LRQEKKRTDGEHMKLRLLEKNELHRQTLQQRQQDSGVVMMDLDTELKRDNDLRGRLAAAATNLKDVESELFFLHKKQARLHKDLDDVMKKIRARRGIADAATAVIPKLEEGLSDVTTSIKLYERECAAVRVEVQRLRDEVLEYKVRFATLEGEEKIRQEELTDLDAGVEAVETEVFQLLAEEKKLGKMLHAYTAQRDLKFRENARLESKERQAHYQVRTRQLSIVDLTKRCSELGNRLKEFSALYEVVKNERNKYVNLIQNSTQALAEMREKIRILQNEIEILGQEFGTKDKALAKERAAHLNARNHRDSIRQEMSKLLYDYRSKQGVIEQQVLEIDKLNAVINLVERDMIELKGRYEHAVRDRNGVGIRLIDCNDELCLLYERSNHHLQTIHRGTAEYASKESELRLSRLQAEELTRELKTAEKRVPQMDMLHASIARLKEEVSRCRLDMDELSQKLETPANKERWRALEGSDLEEGQLQDKILLLETRINDKRAQLLEKDLLLEEVTSLTTKLGAQARAKRDVAKSLTDQLNELQCRIRDTTKRMLAAVSELSMYQATALRLQQEKALREEALERARHRVQIGEPPSEEAVRDLYRTERRREQLGESMQRRLEAERLLATRPMHATKTTAEPRPTAYVPDDEMGIPKPYGKTAPFKPTENGASMRHIRVPIVKDIEV